jgi:tripartite-type tricarboxylate transporter receptor subunit TctC
MKKALLYFLLTISLMAHAEYSAENKIINVIIPQPADSGLGNIFRSMQQYAEKEKITLIPVYKPGASGKIGIDYATSAANDGNILLLSTTTDIVQNNAVNNFDPVTNISEVKLILVASKKSNITHINDILKEPVDKFNWIYSSPAQLHLINAIADHAKLNKSKMHLVPYSTGIGGMSYQISLLNGDADIGYVLYPVAKQFIENNKLTLIELDPLLQKNLDSKKNAVSLFLPKGSNDNTNKFWQEFISNFQKDEPSKKFFETSNTNLLPVGKTNLVKLLSAWSI